MLWIDVEQGKTFIKLVPNFYQNWISNFAFSKLDLTNRTRNLSIGVLRKEKLCSRELISEAKSSVVRKTCEDLKCLGRVWSSFGALKDVKSASKIFRTIWSSISLFWYLESFLIFSRRRKLKNFFELDSNRIKNRFETKHHVGIKNGNLIVEKS
jgi:hypothetical protein